MSRETLELLQNLLNQVSISAGRPDFDEVVAAVAKARRELAEALGSPES